MVMLRTIEKDDENDYKPEQLIQQLDMILLAIREVLPPGMKEELFRKIEEYQGADKKKNSRIKKARELEEADYIYDDLEEEE